MRKGRIYIYIYFIFKKEMLAVPPLYTMKHGVANNVGFFFNKQT